VSYHMEKKIKLNLGCKTDIRHGWINIDIKNYGQNMIYDLDRVPYPFKDNSVDVVLMQDIIEHLKNPELVLREVYRICKDGAVVIIRTPHPKSPNMKKDKSHISPISPDFLKNFNLFPSDVLYYHCQKGLLHYWNQTVVVMVRK